MSLSLYGWPSPAGGGALAEVGAQGRQDCQRPDPGEERRSGGTDHAGLSELGGDRKRLCTKRHQVLQVGSDPQQRRSRLRRSQEGHHRLEVPEILSAEKVLASALITHPPSLLPASIEVVPTFFNNPLKCGKLEGHSLVLSLFFNPV